MFSHLTLKRIAFQNIYHRYLVRGCFVLIAGGASLQWCSTVPGQTGDGDASPAAAAQPAEAPAARAAKRGPMTPIEDDPNLPRVLLIGDSISIGYTQPTRDYLKGIANVHRIPTNGGPTSKGVESIDEWLGDQRWDLIHFNWGLHDLKYLDGVTPENGKQQVPPKEYERNLRELMTKLQQHADLLIFATTTPYPEGVKPLRIPEDAVRYNRIATRLARESGIEINDLYAFTLPQLEGIQREKNVHFLPEGSDALGKHVAGVIKSALMEKK